MTRFHPVELPWSPGRRDRLRRAFDVALTELDTHDYASYRLHGEPHPANRLVTPNGVICVDLESACTGPREWDLAFLDAPDSPGPIDEGLLDCLRRLHHARFATWRWGLLRRHPDLRALAEVDLAALIGSG